MVGAAAKLPLCLLFAVSSARTEAKNLPGVNIHSFQEGEEVKLKVNKLSSTSELYDLDYYSLPFCQPKGGPRMDNQNLGEFLAGDRIESSAYVIKMRKDMYCEQVCLSNVGRSETADRPSNKLVRTIHKGYHNEWIVDNLSAAFKTEDDRSVTTNYNGNSFPVGFVGGSNNVAYVFNHVNIELFYHESETYDASTDDKWSVPRYSVVRFVVEPFSIKHDMPDEYSDILGEDGAYLPRVVNINNPIASCDSSSPYASRPHTSYDMVKVDGRQPQLASGKVLFTYDVIWTEDEGTPWAARWDIYLSMNGAIPRKLHVQSMIESVMLVLVLGISFITLLVRHLRRDLSG